MSPNEQAESGQVQRGRNEHAQAGHADRPELSMRSAVDFWLVALIAGAIGSVVVLAAQSIATAPLQGAGALALAFIAASVVLMRGLPCGYALDHQALHIRGGVQRWRIPYAQIQRIDRLWSPQGAPAWSARRLKIKHSKGVEQISPLDLPAFEAELRRRCGLGSAAVAGNSDS